MAETVSLHENIKLAITTEKLGQEFYERLAQKFAGQQEVADVFARLASDEKAHQAQFRVLLDQLPAGQASPGNQEQHDYLQATAMSQFFQQDYFKHMEKIDSVTDALTKALEFEKATLLYYKAIQEVLGDNPQLQVIIDAERKHVLALVRIIPTDAQFRGLGDTF
jgi:rubrerythrin